MEELRQARAEYSRETAIPEPQTREQRTLSRLDSRVLEALRQVPLTQRYSEATITRVCLRLGISPQHSLRSTRTLRR